jgi:hypothetical protein
MSEETKKYYKVYAKHEFRVCYLVPQELIEPGDNDEGDTEEDQLLQLLCNKDIAYVDNQLRWHGGDEIQSIEFDRKYMDKKGIKVFIEDVDGDPSPTMFPRTTADWDIGFPDDELDSEEDSEDSDVEF